MRPKSNRQLHPRLTTFNGRRAGGENLKRSVEENGVQSIFARARRHASDKSTRPADCPATGRQFANRPEFLPITQAQIAHVAVEAVDCDRIECRRLAPT